MHPHPPTPLPFDGYKKLMVTRVNNRVNSEQLVAIFFGKESQKTNQKESRVEKIIKRKGDKLYVKWKGF